MQDEGDGYDEVSVERTLGYGGMIIRDGVGVPMSEEEALSLAIPDWLESVNEVPAIVNLCLKALQLDHPGVRVVALNAFAVLAGRVEVLPSREAVDRKVQESVEDKDPAVRAAARHALKALTRPT